MAAGYFYSGLAYVQDKGKYGYIDKSGNVVIPCKWNSADNFSYGKAKVKGDDGKWYQINMQGEIVK
jgi:hypothetical protein